MGVGAAGAVGVLAVGFDIGTSGLLTRGTGEQQGGVLTKCALAVTGQGTFDLENRTPKQRKIEGAVIVLEAGGSSLVTGGAVLPLVIAEGVLELLAILVE